MSFKFTRNQKQVHADEILIASLEAVIHRLSEPDQVKARINMLRVTNAESNTVRQGRRVVLVALRNRAAEYEPTI